MVCALAVGRSVWCAVPGMTGDLTPPADPGMTDDRVPPADPHTTDDLAPHATRWNGRRVSAAVFGTLMLAYAGCWRGNILARPIDILIAWPVAWATVAIFLWWFAVRADNSESRRWMAAGIRGGVLVGIIGLVIG